MQYLPKPSNAVDFLPKICRIGHTMNAFYKNLCYVVILTKRASKNIKYNVVELSNIL